MTKNFFSMNGTMYFMPEDSNYLEASYVSEQIADDYGLFQENPQLTIKMPSAYTYFGVNIQFDGNHPKELMIHTYKDENLIESVKFDDLTQNSFLLNEFYQFSK